MRLPVKQLGRGARLSSALCAAASVAAVVLAALGEAGAAILLGVLAVAALRVAVLLARTDLFRGP